MYAKDLMCVTNESELQMHNFLTLVDFRPFLPVIVDGADADDSAKDEYKEVGKEPPRATNALRAALLPISVAVRTTVRLDVASMIVR